MKEQIKRIKNEFQFYLKSGEKRFQFEVNCELKDRIPFIYQIIFPGFKRALFVLRFLIARIAQIIDISAVKIILYRLIGIKIGKGVFISPDVILDPHFPSLIQIEDYVILGWGVHLFPHEFTGTQYRAGKIHIKRGAMIGGFTTIRGGVTVGENANIASMTIVLKDVEKDYYYDTAIVFNKALLEINKEDIK